VNSVLNGYAGLVDVNLKTSLLNANPTTEGILTVPLNKAKEIAAVNGSFTQSADLGSLTVGQTLSFDITIDGSATPISFSLTAPVGGSTPADIVTAINAAAAGTATLVDGKLVLTSNSVKVGTESTIAVSNIVQPAGFGVTSFLASSATGTDLPSLNRASIPSASTTSTSITVYNNSGEAVKLDIYYTKTANETWEMAIYDSRKAKGTASSFPYGKAGDPPLATSTLNFNGTNFKLDSITPGTNTTAPGAGILQVDLGDIDGGSFNLYLGDTTQFTGNTQPLAASVNGNPAEVIKDISVGKDGTITAAFASGASRVLFKVPLAMVNSPDSMIAKAGNVYAAGVESGTVLMGFGGSAGFGNLTAGALEDSTVDMASELTTMIESQRSYTANSKVFQTGSEILDVLVNLKR
jgi:flagellar hook protein FlgE